jgi:hypothetical protein
VRLRCLWASGRIGNSVSRLLGDGRTEYWKGRVFQHRETAKCSAKQS